MGSEGNFWRIGQRSLWSKVVKYRYGASIGVGEEKEGMVAVQVGVVEECSCCG